jgi:hypothetical protein
MKSSKAGWERQIACILILSMAGPVAFAATDPLPEAPRPVVSTTGTKNAPPGSMMQTSGYSSSLLLAQADHQSPLPAPGQAAPADQETTQPGQQGAPANHQPNAPQQPVGTAAAPYVRPEGIPASRPAGAAIAPAKQRRVRIYAIRIALLVGAAVAIGTVVAASEGSPARP